MSWLSDRSLFALAVLLYGISTVFAVLVWRRGFRQDNRALYLLLVGGLLLHTLSMVRRGFSFQSCPINNLYEATLFVLWTAGVAYLLIGGFRRLRFLGVFVSPLLFCVGVFALMPALDPPRGPRPDFNLHHAWQSLHAALILLAYGAFGLGGLSALMYLLEAHNLKFHKAQALASLLPPISRLESATRGLILAGVVLLSGGLVTGMRYLKLATGSYASTDPFLLYSMVTWALYVAILVAAARFGQRGRRLAWAAAGGFMVLLLTFWGVYLLSDLHRPHPGNDRSPAVVLAPPARLSA